jgi:hypothetical protein
MSDNSEIAQLLKIIIINLNRNSFPEEELRSIVTPTKRSASHLKAYNLCDGSRTRPEVYKAAGLDKDNFNKLVKQWIKQGVIYEIKVEDEVVLLHLYPLIDL